MDTSSSIPVRSSGIPRPTSRLPVARAAGPPAPPSQLRTAASSDTLRKKPSLSSIARPGQQPQAQPPPKPQLSLRTKTSRSSLARSNTSASTSVAANTSFSRTPLSAATRRASALPAIGTHSRPSTSDGTAFNKRPFARPPSRQTRPTPQPSPPLSGGLEEDVLGDLDGFRSASRASSRAGFHENDSEQECAVETAAEPPKPLTTKKSRPSLSERTIESLAQIPASPAGGKGRRRSSFFNSENNGMPPPLRPASALSNNGKRPTTSDGTPKATPATPRRFGAPAGRGSMTAPGKRSVSAAMTTTTPMATPSKTNSISRPVSTIKKPPLSQMHNTLATPKVRPLSNSKSMTARTPKTRPSLADTFGQAISPPGTAVSSPATPSPSKNISTRKTPETIRKVSSSSTALREHIAKAKAARRSDVGFKVAETSESSEPAVTTPSKPVKSSNALREQIAKAKQAARQAKATSPVRTSTPPRDAIIPDPSEIATFDFGLDDDPFNQRSKGSKSLLRKRVDAARVDGRLNLAAMGLKEIPEEVLNMYKYDPNDNTIAWGEVVDLTAVLIADNELEFLPESMFPDVDMESMDDSDDVSPQFGGVQSLDLHGNVLRELPMGLRRLMQLSKLNLSRNKLSVGVFETISQIPTLRELKLAENELEGDLPACLGSLAQLESLELQGNKIHSLPPEIRELAHLRTLNISDNRIGTLPAELFTSIPMIELLASRNSFSGSFFNNVNTVPHLQRLQISNNSLTCLCDSGELSLPAMQYLDISVNRLSSLPDMSSWVSLTTLLVGENKLTLLPEGFISLQQLRSADFTANDLSKIDERIALMEGLENLTLAANPLRERKFLTMNAEDIKRDLYSRLEPSLVHAISEEEATEEQAPAGAESDWKLTPSGTLDFSFQNLTEVEEGAMASFAQSNDVRQLYLQQNYLTSIPVVLSQITHLSVLDLSKNNIIYPLSEPLLLPKLRELRLNGNKIVSLFSLTTHLSAPALQHLDVSNNRITGSLPVFRDSFPALFLLMANDNSIDEVSAESLQGLKIVNLSNNDIARLEPQIGLHAGTLTSLDVEGNKFRVPNYAVLKKGTEAVLAWLRDKIPSPAEEFVNPSSPGSPGY